MSDHLSLQYQRLCAHCGAAFVVLYAIFWCGFGHNLPPLAAANLSAHDLAAIYAQHRWSYLVGNSVAAAVGVLWAPWTAQLFVALKRIEGDSPVLSYLSLIGGALTTWVVIFCPAIWVAAAYRPDMPADIVRALNDLGYFTFNLTYAGTTLQAIAAGAVGLADGREIKLFPRWVSWWAIVTGLSFIPITLMPFGTSGPFSWDGLVSFWIGFGTFFSWCVSMGICMAAEAKRRLNAQSKDFSVPSRTGGKARLNA